ncbi:MAG: hypothetical protein ACLPN6_08810 [Streptosporangiaceae bacterium]|jgi:hypothetical protein|nr:hypothetical protein [Actinomycetota bacterium]
MPEPEADYGCCDRLAGSAGTACAARAARRRLLKAAVFQHQLDARSAAHARPGGEHSPVATGSSPSGAGARGAQAAGTLASAGFPDASQLPRAVAGTILDVSPQVLVIGDEGGEQRFILSADAGAWRGGSLEPAGLRPGDHAVIRLQPGQRDVADRVWANIGRVTGTIIEHSRDGLIVDEGATRRRQVVVIPPRAAGRIQVRFPTLQPGYLVDVIGLRRGAELEGLVPATSQPAYPVGRVPVSPLVSGHVPETISGSATWHEDADEAPGVLGIAYPELDPETRCAEYAAAGRTRGYARLPYLAIGSAIGIRNDCSGRSCVLPVIGCAAVARLFNDRCVTCGTSPRGRIADLTLASFVALGGELERGCFNARIRIGR